MKTMLDKCAVAGDITQAIDRRGAWTCAIVIAGGTELTAVKLQSCDTADGSFSDFKTLIPASEAEADQYKGFVIDLDGAKKFIKVTGATMATCVLGDCDVDVKQVAIKAGEIPSGADLENNKTATIDVSTYTEPVEIEPTAGKDGMKKATVTLSNIPSGAGKRTICVQGAMGDSDGYIEVKGFDSASNDLTPSLPKGTYHFYFFSTDTSGTINTVTAIFADPSKVSVSGDILTVSEDAGFETQDSTYSAGGWYSALFQSTN